ncbi:TetR/AcrR family transcriptional regulator [Phenylobacterium sp. 20VBR1]|uniref:TetR/AcrR family transcriptional regulator n=1 Tax=Phenylobacterium glaciei TaxID=2803784 RepID=A0A941CXP6_9CAUL|nr:TetR/AcrR family transcriptional regulator [Phenylobacterium glaciei]
MPDELRAIAGSLRRRALDAARMLLEAGGVDGLHLRAIAAEVRSGVATLYHHFADKHALLAALAIEGWEELARAIDQAMGSGKFPHRIDAASRAFLTFIRRNPQLYALMQTEQALAANDAVRAAERAAFATFQTSFQGDDRVPPERVEEVSLTIWVLGRGIASAVLMQGDDDPAAAGRLVAKVIAGFGFLLSPRFAD